MYGWTYDGVWFQMKVFGVGMFKTGTTSLEHALTLLNFKHVPPIKYFDAFTNLPDIDYDFINHTCIV